MSAITQADILAFASAEVRPKPPRTPVQIGSPANWRPAVNAYCCHEHFVVFVEAAGLRPDSLELIAGPRALTIRGARAAPEPGCARVDLTRLLALEIDHGSFERTVQFPQEIVPEGITTSYADGLLRIEVPRAPGAA